MGRPLIEITPEICKKAESLAAQGLTMDQIAHTLGMGKTTLYEKVNTYAEFSNAIEQGRSKGIAQVTNALFKKATDGDVAAQKYYLNNRDNDNWKDRIESKQEISGPGGKAQEHKWVVEVVNAPTDT
jgi:hypothetical protein